MRTGRKYLRSVSACFFLFFTLVPLKSGAEISGNPWSSLYGWNSPWGMSPYSPYGFGNPWGGNRYFSPRGYSSYWPGYYRSGPWGEMKGGMLPNGEFWVNIRFGGTREDIYRFIYTLQLQAIMNQYYSGAGDW